MAVVLKQIAHSDRLQEDHHHCDLHELELGYLKKLPAILQQSQQGLVRTQLVAGLSGRHPCISNYEVLTSLQQEHHELPLLPLESVENIKHHLETIEVLFTRLSFDLMGTQISTLHLSFITRMATDK